MKTLFASVAAVVALAGAAAPAAAQSYDRYDDRYERSFRYDAREVARRLDRIDQRIHRGVDRGQLTRREAVNLRSELRDIARLNARYRSGGLSHREVAVLDRRLDRLEVAVRFERNDRQYGYRR